MTRYRWYYDECEKHSISGVVEAETFDDAVEEVKSYLDDQFDDFNGKMSFVLPEDSGETTLWGSLRTMMTFIQRTRITLR